jgi:hypothetical protein
MATLGVSLEVETVTSSNVSCTVTVDAGYKPPAVGKRLREGDRLEDAGVSFALSSIGDIWLGNIKAPDSSDVVSQKTGSLVGADYGFTLFVDSKGQVHLAKSVDEEPKQEDIVKTWKPTPELMSSLQEKGLAGATDLNEASAPEDYVLKVEGASRAVSVQRRSADGSLNPIYTVFKSD